jgi:hypothetical protein
LPGKDAQIGESLLEKKDFEGLKMLVDSALYLARKNQSKEVIPDKYKDIDTISLTKLKSEVDNYYTLINNILGEEDYESEIEDVIFDEEAEL